MIEAVNKLFGLNAPWKIAARRVEQAIRRYCWSLSIARAGRDRLWDEKRLFSQLDNLTGLERVNRTLGLASLYRYTPSERRMQAEHTSRILVSIRGDRAV